MRDWDYERRQQQRAAARADAMQMADEDLLTYANQIKQQDQDAIDRGFRGMLDHPHWTYVTVAAERGLFG